MEVDFRDLDFDSMDFGDGKTIEFDAIEKIIPKSNWRDNAEATRMDRTTRLSEKAYINTTDKIVDAAVEQLDKQISTKRKLKVAFTRFFMGFIFVQYFFMILLFLIKAFLATNFPETVILAYITSVFVETLGAMIIMVTYSFTDKEEVSIISILSGVVSKYQKR